LIKLFEDAKVIQLPLISMIIIRKLNSIFYDNVVVDNFFRIFLGIK